MNTEAKKKTPETAVWYFIGATFAFALGPTLFSGGDPTSWRTILITLLGAALFISGCVAFVKESRVRKEAKAEQATQK